MAEERAGEMCGLAMSRRERKKREVRERICTAAMELFRERGYHATTVEGIAQRADVAKGTFFNYFPRKENVLTALQEGFVEELLAELGPPESWQGTFRDQLFRLLFRTWDMAAAESLELLREFFMERLRIAWLGTGLDRVDEEFRGLIRGTIERAQARDEVRADADPVVATKLIDAVYATTLVECLQRRASREAFENELTRQLDIIFRGLGVDAGSAGRG